jgi:hypothetical protein
VPAEDAKSMTEMLDGNFDGIGVEFNIQNDTIYIVSAIVGGPSEALGIQRGGRIVNIEGKNVAGTGMTNEKVMKSLRGPKGTTVNVGIIQRGEKKAKEYDMALRKHPSSNIELQTVLTDFADSLLSNNRFVMNDKNGNPIPFANILIKENESPSSIVEFTNVRNGKFNSILKKKYQTILVEVTSQEYFDETFIIQNPKIDETYSIDFKTYAEKWSTLPLYSNKEEMANIFKSINNNQVTLVISGTGSGKTVLIPKFLLKYFYEIKKDKGDEILQKTKIVNV